MSENSIVLFPVSLKALEELIQKSVKNGIADQLITLGKERSQAQEDQWITRKEAAKLLGVSTTTLWEWTNNGTVTGYRISTRLRYKKSEVEDSLKKINESKSKK